MLITILKELFDGKPFYLNTYGTRRGKLGGSLGGEKSVKKVLIGFFVV